MPVAALLFFCSCRRISQEPLPSPSGLFKLKIDLNKDRKDKTKYDCLRFTLYDKNDKKITTLQTDASDYMKWAVGWCPHKDTILLNSRDIGTYAYHLTSDQWLDTIRLTPDLDSIADTIFFRKYAGHSAR